MTDFVRMIAVGGTLGALVAGSLAAPAYMSALADEPVAAVAGAITDLFPPPVDPKVFRKYDITLDGTVSTDAESTRTVSKIAFGHKTSVSIVTTRSGTYSTDALLSPHVRYPGIEVTPRHGDFSEWVDASASAEGDGHWLSYAKGSIIYFVFSAGPLARS